MTLNNSHLRQGEEVIDRQNHAEDGESVCEVEAKNACMQLHRANTVQP